MAHMNSTVVYGSETERVVALVFLVPCSLYALGAQTLILFTVYKSPALHNPHFYLMVVSCCVDMATVSLSAPMFIEQYVTGTIHSVGYCKFMTFLLSVLTVGFFAHIGLVACERYVYFCQPFRYLRLFSARRCTLAVTLCYSSSLVVTTVTSLVYERRHHPSELMCTTTEPGVQELILFVAVILPAASITLICMWRIWRLIKHAHTTHDISTPVQQSHKTLRMLLLLSGLHWGISLPLGIARVSIFISGFSYADPHGYGPEYDAAPVIFNRFVVLTACMVPSATNPAIYLYTRRDLRDAVHKLIAPAPQPRQPNMEESTLA